MLVVRLDGHLRLEALRQGNVLGAHVFECRLGLIQICLQPVALRDQHVVLAVPFLALLLLGVAQLQTKRRRRRRTAGQTRTGKNFD